MENSVPGTLTPQLVAPTSSWDLPLSHPELSRSYLQEEVTQVLVVFQQPQSRFLELRFAPEGAFPLPGSPC